MSRDIIFHISQQANLRTIDVVPLADGFLNYPEKEGGASYCVKRCADFFTKDTTAPFHVITCRDELINYAGRLIYENILDYTKVKVKIYDAPRTEPRTFDFDKQGSLLKWEYGFFNANYPNDMVISD